MPYVIVGKPPTWRGKLQQSLLRDVGMVFDRLRELFGTPDEDSGETYRCVNCGAEFDRNVRECPDCGGPFVAPVEDEGRNA